VADTNLKGPSQNLDNTGRKHLGWFFVVALAILILGGFFRLWDLGITPPGMLREELVNAQISDRFRAGDIAVIYDEVSPAREGLYYGVLAASTALTGRGLILWRLPSVWMALITLALNIQLMRRLFGRRIALLATGLMAVAFWPVWMGRAVLHVTLVPLMIVLVAYTLVRAFQAREFTDASLWFTFGGLVLGLAQYAHVTSWTMPALFLAFVVYRYLIDRKNVRPYAGNIVYMLGLVLVLALPLLIFLLRNPGVREPVPLTEQTGVLAEIPGRLLSSLAGLVLRGDMEPGRNLPGRPVLDPLSGMLMVIGFGVCIARWRRSQYGLAILWMVVGLLPTLFLPHRPHFEYMAVVLPIIFIFPAIGLQAIFATVRDRSRLSRQMFSTVFGVLAGLLIIGNAVWTFWGYFIVWPNKGDVRLNYQADIGLLAHYLDTSRDPSPISICSVPADLSANRFALSNEDLLAYFMHRQGMPIRYFNCKQSLVLADGGASQRLIFPGGHYYDDLPGPLLAWMRYARDEQVPGIRPDVVMRIDVEQIIADRVGVLITTKPVAWPPEAVPGGLAPLPVSFGYNLDFLGYEVRNSTLRPGDFVELTNYWRLNGPPPPQIKMFTHLLGNPVVVLAQNDSLGVKISSLRVRDVFLEYSVVQVPGEVRAGSYVLSVGMYDPITQARLPAFQDGNYRADRLYLQSITVLR